MDGVSIYYVELKMANDTSLSTEAYPTLPENAAVRIIETNISDTIPGSYKQIFKNNPDKLLMLYLFFRDTMEQVPWDRIVEAYLT